MFVAERQYVSQFAQDLLGLTVRSAGLPVDPDGQHVLVTMINEDTETTVFSRDATRFDVAEYQTHLTSAESGQTGRFRVRWSYTVDGVAEIYEGHLLIGPASPSYDALAPGMKEVVDQVWSRFEDAFDSPDGGPNLQTYWQSNFSRGRVAQLLRVAVGRLNTVAQPYQSYSVDGDGGASFPVTTWGSLLERALYVEVIKHLRRSYVEQPMFMGGQVTRQDRRDYLDRWGQILADEEDDLRAQLDTFKISNMGLGRPAVLVSGGVYGRWAPTRYAGSAAARGRFFNRFW